MTNANDLIHSFSGSNTNGPNYAGLTKRELFAKDILCAFLSNSNYSYSIELCDKALRATDMLITVLNEKQDAE